MKAVNTPKVGFVSLGCPKALVDSERILTRLRAEGYEVAPSYRAADLVVALHWEGRPEYSRLRGLANAVAGGLADRIAAGATLYLMLDGDVARTLGLLLREELGIANDLVVIDGVLLRDFDYVDLGRVRQPSGTVPVTIKSLVFGQ